MATRKQGRECVLHLNSNITGEIKAFDESTWAKVKACDKRRHSVYKDSKFFDIKLPDNHGDSIGYHSQCYRQFTAIPITTDQNQPTSSRTHLRSKSTSSLNTSHSGIFPAKCIFCSHEKRYMRGKTELLGSCETESAEQSIRTAAETLQDETILVQIAGIDLKSKEVKYHHSCKRDFLNRARLRSHSQESKDSSDRNKLHIAAFNKLKDHIQLTLVDEPGAELLTSLHRRYISLLGESTYTAQKLSEKILKEYPTELRSCKISNKQGIVIHNVSIDRETAIRRANVDDHSVIETAMYLRTKIMAMMNEQNDLSNPVTAECVIKGQGDTPESLVTFFRTLYTGCSNASGIEKNERLVQSSCDDAVFITTRGRTKPAKHLCMGLGLKSITGSRKVVEILNHYGHSVSYHTVESIETDLATNIADKKAYTPDGIVKLPGLSMGVAWDNYDENTETLSGGGTLHETVGICYQNVTVEEAPETEDVPANDTPGESTQSSKKSKRTLTLKESILQPYRKKPKIASFAYQIRHIHRPMNMSTIEYTDMLWMICQSCGETPMWPGWNSLISDDPLPLQRIAYLDSLNLPPTRLDVVAETLKISQEIAAECDEPYVIVHYDLAIAKPAMQIQEAESPKFDNVFICFGPFHIEMAFFATLGYLIDGSGGPELLTDSEVLATGSLSGFILGKHYNRCRRLHLLLATGFRILHFRKFLLERGHIPESLEQDIQKAQRTPTPDLVKAIMEGAEFQSLAQDYISYSKETVEGDHGCTAQFWFIYMELVEIFLHFNRACRTNDVDLFIYALNEMCPMFFACHRPNYARWMVRYLHNLINMDNTHPGIREAFMNGALSIRRTEHPFARNAVDITLEQTINADAASRSTGITAFSQSEAAKRRWMITRSVRSKLVGHLLQCAGMKHKEDVSKSLRPSRQTRDYEDLQKIIDSIQNTMNPFDLLADQNLYCLTTGKKVDEKIKCDLLSCRKNGLLWMEEFVNECFDDATRFERPIKRRKFSNFTTAAVQAKVKTSSLKLVELQGTRDLFGRLLFLSTVQSIDLEKVFQYPLTPVPLSLCHIDGTPNKTDKAKLLKKLEKMVPNEPPKTIDTVVIDAMFFLHTLVRPPPTYGELAMVLLHQICGMAQAVHFVCDNYWDPSIKDCERSRRGAVETTLVITGPGQKTPRDWQKSLKSSSFKQALFRFLALEWRSDKYIESLGTHQLVMALDETCYRYTVSNQSMLVEEVDDLKCQHEEADTRMIFHLYHITSAHDLSISVRSNDTDVLILLLHHYPKLNHNPQVWMDVGLSSNNSRRFINVGQIAESMGNRLLDSLPGFHALTGSDATTAFMSKGKLRPFDLIIRNQNYSDTLAELGAHNAVPEHLHDGIEKYVCAIYGKSHMAHVNDVRYAYFQQNYAPKKADDPLGRIKGMNPSGMPPCKSVLHNKTLRSNYLAYTWRHAANRIPQSASPTDHGWTLVDGKYQINWFNCEQVPESLCRILDYEDVPVSLEAYTEDPGLWDHDSDDSDDDWE